jgi:hypothetical protein
MLGQEMLGLTDCVFYYNPNAREFAVGQSGQRMVAPGLVWCAYTAIGIVVLQTLQPRVPPNSYPGQQPNFDHEFQIVSGTRSRGRKNMNLPMFIDNEPGLTGTRFLLARVVLPQCWAAGYAIRYSVNGQSFRARLLLPSCPRSTIIDAP